MSEAEGAPEGFEPLDALADLEVLQEPEGRIAAQTRAELPGISVGERAGYVIREYIGLAPGQAGRDGNFMLVEQRILALEPWTGKESNHD